MSVIETKQRKKPRDGFRLPAQPLIDWLEYTEQIDSIDGHTRRDWLKYGLSVYNADKWAIRCGVHPIRLWGWEFYQGCRDV